jgi:hypothetical protein
MVLRLYRHILRAVATFPSKNRLGLRDEIRGEFRRDAALTEPAAVQKAVDAAHMGLEQLQQYSSIDMRSHSIAVDMANSPMPRPPMAAERPPDGEESKV